MELKDKLLSSFLVFEDRLHDEPKNLNDIRNEAIESFQQKGFPSKKDEDWKYTSLNAVLKHDYCISPKQETAIEFKEVKKYFIHDIDTYKIVFIDGKYSSFLSETTHDGIDVCLMSSALNMPKYKIIIDSYYNNAAKSDHSLTSLNTAFASEGAYIHIPKNKVVTKSIQLIHFSTGNEASL